MLTEAFLAFGAGVAASLSPCDYPLLPVIVGFIGTQAGEKKRSRVIGFVLGQTLALISLGVVTVSLGETLGFSSQSPLIRKGMGLVLLVAGVFSWRGRLPILMGRWNRMANRWQRSEKTGALGAFLLGAGGTLLISPCTSPILGGVLILISEGATLWRGLVLMSAYSLGFTILFLVLGFGVIRMSKLPRVGNWMRYFHLAGSGLLIFSGLYFLSVFDGWV